MGALKGRGLPSRLKAAPSRFKSRPVAVGGDTRERRSKDWLNTSRWQKLRLKILERDSYTCQQTGAALVGKHPAPNSPVVDHIKPHRGDPELFWDEDNLQSVSKEWHDSTKQSLERRGLA